jgi:hypothetical protein
MAGAPAKASLGSITRDCAVNELGGAGMDGIPTDSNPVEPAGTKPFHEHVSRVDQLEEGVSSCGRLEVDSQC